MAQFGCLTIVIILSVSLHQTFATRCWSCNSETNPACGDPFNPNYIDKSFYVECESHPVFEPASCLKAKSTSTGHVQRECRINTMINTIESRAKCELDEGPNVRECLFCDTDGCNGVSKCGPAAAVIIVIIGVYVLNMLGFI